jgi:hypothetical protein
MSAEIINLFTSNQNINYLYNYLDKNLKESSAKQQILETLIETIFNFYDHEIIDNSTYKLRHSVDKWDEVRKLNKSFIDDRIAFCTQYDSIGIDSYQMQMFTDDSLNPKGYNFNETKKRCNCNGNCDCNCNGNCNSSNGNKLVNNDRIFRYENKYDVNKSRIPIQQILSRGNADITNNDSFHDSYYNLKDKVQSDKIIKDYENTLYYNDKTDNYFDI